MGLETGFWSMNLSAALMVLVVIGIRELIKNKVPHIVIGLMWCVVVLRLYIPYSFATDYNIYNALYYIRKTIADMDLFEMGHSMYYFDRVCKMAWEIPQVKFVILVIWLVGSIFIWRYFLRSYRITKKIWRTAGKSPAEKEVQAYLSSLNLNKKVTIKESPLINIPVACGVFDHGIILPVNFEKCPQKMVRQVLVHEYMHLRYWHPLLQHIAVFILCLNWFNPAIWLLYHFISRDLEMACDKHVVEVIGEEERELYARHLVFLSNLKNREYAFFNGFIKGSSKRIVKERIVAIMKYKKLSALAVAFCMLIPMGVASAMGTNSNYVFGDEINNGNLEIAVVNESFVEDDVITVAYEDLEPYVIEQQVRATRRINIERYERTYTSPSIPSEIEVTTQRDGYTYAGTLKLVDMEKSGSKYIGYYSGTLYRQ